MKNHKGISARQIKAARALVDWSQEQLAEASGLSIATIRKIESGSISPRGATMGGIQRALEGAGLEFMEPNGVRQRPEEITVYEGREGINAFFNHVYSYASTTSDAHIVQVTPSDSPFGIAMGKEADAHHMHRMASIKHRFTLNCILTEDTADLSSSSYCEYRYVPKGLIDSVPFYVYDDKYAIIVFDKGCFPRITVISSAPVADAFRRQFYSMWDKATPLNPPPRDSGKKKTKK